MRAWAWFKKKRRLVCIWGSESKMTTFWTIRLTYWLTYYKWQSICFFVIKAQIWPHSFVSAVLVFATVKRDWFSFGGIPIMPKIAHSCDTAVKIQISTVLLLWMFWQMEGKMLHHLAIDRPSPKFISFLKKYYGLRNAITQVLKFPTGIDLNSRKKLPFVKCKMSYGFVMTSQVNGFWGGGGGIAMKLLDRIQQTVHV